MPVLLWTALRFGPKECVAGATVVSVLAIRNTLEGNGPFAAHPPNHTLLMLQSFISVLMLATLATAAEARERRAREQELQLLNRELEEHGGLGLGLAIVQHIIERHDGTVAVTNGPPGTGAIFTARLPALAGKEVT